MASTTRDERAEGVESVHEDDGTVTARDLETGLARGGETRAEALRTLAEVIALAEGEGDPSRTRRPSSRTWTSTSRNGARRRPGSEWLGRRSPVGR
jgi:hypothetical protein